MTDTDTDATDAEPRPTWPQRVLREAPARLLTRTGNRTLDERAARDLDTYLRRRNAQAATLLDVERERDHRRDVTQ